MPARLDRLARSRRSARLLHKELYMTIVAVHKKLSEMDKSLPYWDQKERLPQAEAASLARPLAGAERASKALGW